MQVELRHVYKSFPQNGGALEVLRDINLTVAQGEFVCLLGPSGCGKSTIVHLLAGLDQATSGDVLVGGRPITGPDASRTVVFQEPALFPWLSVLGNVEFGLRMTGVAPPQRRARALDHDGFEDRLPHERPRHIGQVATTVARQSGTESLRH